MRVTHAITDTNIGGAGRYLVNLLTQPAFGDVDVTVICPDGALGERIDAAGISRIGTLGEDISHSFALTRELLETFKKTKPDLVHTHSCLSGRIAAKLRGIPCVYTKHNLVRIPDESGVVPPKAGSTKRLANKAAARTLSDAVIAVSGGVAEQLAESGVPSSLVATVPNGIDLGPYAPREARQPGTLIGTVARLHRQKALEVWLEAASQIVAVRPDAEFAIAGTGPLRDEVETMIRELGLGSHVRLHGFVSDVPSFLAKLDIYMLSSDYEGLPLAVLEAMAASLPIVSTAVGGVVEAVADGVSGFLVPPRKPEDLAAAVLRLLEEGDLALQMGAASRERAERMFDAKDMARKTVDVYRKVLGRRSR